MPAATSCAKEGPLRTAKGLAVAAATDLGHAEEGGLFDALAGAEDDLVCGEQRRDVGDDAAEMLRGRDAEEDVGFEDGAGQIGGDVDVDGEGEAGEVGEVLPASASCSASVAECDQRQISWPPRRARERASAVPQAPAPEDCDCDSCRRLFFAEATFGAGEEAADVFVVLDDDEQGDEEEAGDDDGRARGTK